MEEMKTIVNEEDLDSTYCVGFSNYIVKFTKLNVLL